MLKKTLIATGTLAVIMFAVQPQAEAKTHFHFDIGVGLPGYGGGYAPGYYNPGYYAPRFNRSVRRVLRGLRHRGYRGFRKVRDRGGYVTVKAYKFGSRYKLKVSKYNGRILRRWHI